ncbi:hypothetical protein VNO77_40555 [Canavalia gladiata]|uniref:BZIP domain-containing protein n=1 Tax=Canavalia gladiata TaxID=3824 RepID=A0AAN9JYY6_CANGL
MEEVWKEINLASLNEQNIGGRSKRSNLGGVMFQDFLGRPFSTIDPPNSSQTASIYCPASPAPLTVLSLSSRPHFHFDPLTPKPSHPPPISSTTSSSSNFNTPSPLLHTFPCPSSFSSLPTKTFPQPPPDCNLGDRRNKRMIKNRESAARSRARKQEKIASFFLFFFLH